VPGVKPAFNRSRESIVIFPLGLDSPWLRMKPQPRRTFRLPSGAQVMWHSIGKSKGNEVNRAFLLPVWETISRETNILVRIEKLQAIHRLGFRCW
jgi:hypothetical protein